MNDDCDDTTPDDDLDADGFSWRTTTTRTTASAVPRKSPTTASTTTATSWSMSASPLKPSCILRLRCVFFGAVDAAVLPRGVRQRRRRHRALQDRSEAGAVEAGFLWIPRMDKRHLGLTVDSFDQIHLAFTIGSRREQPGALLHVR